MMDRYEGTHDYGDDHQEDHEEEYHAEEYHEEENHEEEYHAEEYHEDDDAEGFQAAVEHQADYASVAGAESDLAATQFGWRRQARLGRREGTWVPVDTRGVKAPVFVPLGDLFLPWHIPGPSDKKKRLPGPDADTLRLIERIYEAL